MAARDQGLFGDLAEQHAPSGPRGAPRLSSPERGQVTWQALALDDLLPADHRARQVWAFAARVDLSLLTAEMKAREGGPGRAAAVTASNRTGNATPAAASRYSAPVWSSLGSSTPGRTAPSGTRTSVSPISPSTTR